MSKNIAMRAAPLGVLVTVLLSSVAIAQDSKIEFGSGMANGFPESVTSTSDGTLYAGSFTGGMINRAAPGATTVEAFIEKPAEGPGSVIGVYADEANKTLWACYADAAIFQGGEAMPSILRSYDLASGEETGAYTFPAGPSFCNDIATTADGTAYAADTMGARIIRIAPGATEAEDWFADAALAGVDGLSFGPDGALYLNSVTTNKLFRLDMGADGAAGTLTELTVSEPLMGPDGMRFGPDGVLYLAENGAGRVDAVTIDGDNATVRELQGGFEQPTAVTLVGDTLWVAEAKLGKMGGTEDPGTFYLHPVTVTAEANTSSTSAETAPAGTEADAAAAGSEADATAATPETAAPASESAGGDDYAGLISSLQGLGDVDVATIGSGEIRIVRRSELGEVSDEQQAELEQALSSSQAAIDEFRQALAGSQLGQAVDEAGIGLDDVLSVLIDDNDTLTIYVDDSTD